MGSEKPHIMIKHLQKVVEPANRVRKKKAAPLLDKGNGATGTVWYGRRDSNPQAYFSGKF